MVGAIGLRQTVSYIRQTDAGGRLAVAQSLRLAARAGVGDGDQHPVARPPRLDRDVGAFLLGRHRIFDRILDQRLQQQRGQPRAGHRRVDFEARAQPVLEPHLLDLQIELQRLHFLLDRHLSRRLVDQRVAKERRKARQHRIGAVGLLEQHQRRDRIERIEQEVRVELIAQHRELRGRRLVLEMLHLVDLILDDQVEVDAEIERRPAEQRGEGDVEGHQHARQRHAGLAILDQRPGERVEKGGEQRRQREGEDRQDEAGRARQAAEIAVQRREQQRHAIADDRFEDHRDDDVERQVGQRRGAAEQQVAGPADGLQRPEGAAFVLEERTHVERRAGWGG